uniref:Uncharacterized protein n=1 Tax=Caenorhabditis tropicalis TaxID=1561998 RepID=A0A1I7TKL2_9PELO
MGDNSFNKAGTSNSSIDEEQISSPSQQDNYKRLPKQRSNSKRTEQLIKRPPHQMRVPIILPKLPAKLKATQGTAIHLMTSPPSITPSSSNPRPLISLLDRTEFRDRTRVAMNQPAVKPKKCYYTELNEIRREFGIPESFNTTKPNTMSGVALAEKLQILQRLRGENKFLQESIEKNKASVKKRPLLLNKSDESRTQLWNIATF